MYNRFRPEEEEESPVIETDIVLRYKCPVRHGVGCYFHSLSVLVVSIF